MSSELCVCVYVLVHIVLEYICAREMRPFYAPEGGHHVFELSVRQSVRPSVSQSVSQSVCHTKL